MTKAQHFTLKPKRKTRTTPLLSPLLTDTYIGHVKQAPAMKIAKVKAVKLPVPTEKVVHLQICTTIKFKWPEIIFHSDFAAAARMTVGQIMANKSLQSERGWPDLHLAIPKRVKGILIYCGLYIEIKRDRDKLYLKDGTIKEDWKYVYKKKILIEKYDHHKEQAEILERLNILGYKAVFGCGYEECVSIIENYLKN